MFSQIKRIQQKPPPLKKRLQLKQGLEQRMQELIDVLESHNLFRGLAIKLGNGLNAWFTCIEHLFVEPTNNRAERALRELIVQRKIIGGLRAEHGADTMGIVNTMLATWKQQEKPLFQTLKTAISC
ncbi:MAG: transposase [Candidatus Diapherotrites archaeon]